MKPTLTQVFFVILGIIFLALTGAETPESWDFAYFLAYHIGMLALCAICFYFAGKQRKPFSYVIAPEGCVLFLTPGKKYKVLKLRELNDRKLGNYLFGIIDDDGDRQETLNMYDCLPGRGVDWIIPEIGQWPNGWTYKQKSECLRKAGIKRSLFMRILDDSKDENQSDGVETSYSSFQGRSFEQLSGSYKIGAICFVALVVLLVIAAIIQ